MIELDTIKTVIFDMDGVIIDSEPLYFEIEKILFDQYQIAMSDAEHHLLVGVTYDNMWKQLKKKYDLPERAALLAENHKKLVIEYMPSLDALKPIENLIILLKSLKYAKKNIALASSSPRKLIDIILDKIHVRQYFDCVVSGDEVKRGKPEPDIFLKVSMLTNSDPLNCLVIEDSHNGVKASKSAGMKCVGYKNLHSGNQDLSMADVVITDFKVLIPSAFKG